MSNLINSYKNQGNDDDDDPKTSSAESTMERVSSDSQIKSLDDQSEDGSISMQTFCADSYGSLEAEEEEEKAPPSKRRSMMEVSLWAVC